jgi:hypothetical protein
MCCTFRPWTTPDTQDAYATMPKSSIGSGLSVRKQATSGYARRMPLLESGAPELTRNDNTV